MTDVTNIEKRFLDEFTDRVVDNAYRYEQLDLRVRRIEKYLDKDFKIKCKSCRYMTSSRHEIFSKTLYCEKCDQLFCRIHYCEHLNEFIRNR